MPPDSVGAPSGWTVAAGFPATHKEDDAVIVYEKTIKANKFAVTMKIQTKRSLARVNLWFNTSKTAVEIDVNFGSRHSVTL